MPTSKQTTEVLREWAEVFMRRSMHETIRFWKESELSMPQISVLMQIQHHGPCGISNVGAQLGVTNAAASQMVEKLVQMDMLERTEDPHDRRAKQLRLTPRGRSFMQKGMEARRRWLEDLATGLTSDQQKAIVTALPYLTEAARQLESKD